MPVEDIPGDPFADAVIRVAQTRLVLQYRPVVRPGDVPKLAEALQDRLSSLEPPVYGVIAADFLSPATMDRIGKAGLGALDRSGNGRLAFGKVYIERRGNPNPRRVVQETRSLFAPKAQRVLRLLLSAPLRAWSGVELAKACDISPGWVTGVRKALFAQDLATGGRGAIQVRDPREILRLWALADKWRDRTQVFEYSSLLGKNEICRILAKEYAGRDLAFTQWIAASLRRPMTETDLVTAYVGNLPSDAFIKAGLLARPVERDGNVRLVVPKDAGVFLAGQEVDGLPLVGDPQIWLDLQGAGQRADEQARALWEWDGIGGWNA